MQCFVVSPQRNLGIIIQFQLPDSPICQNKFGDYYMTRAVLP